MSETAPEQTAPRPTGQGSAAKRGLMKKIGPLPLWAWGGLAIGGALAVYFAQQGKGKKKQTPTAQPTAQATGQPYPFTGYSSMPTAQATAPAGTGTTSTTQTVTQTGGGASDEAADKTHPDKPGQPGKTGGWKGQHSNGQGSHHGKAPAKAPAKGKTTTKA